jgi:hypothetical protein
MAYRAVKDAQGNRGYAKLVPFTYDILVTIPAATLLAGASISASIQTDPGMPFILTELGGAYSLDITAITAYENRLTFTLLDGQSQQNFQNGPVPRERMFGTRDFPRQLPQEVELPPADQITLTMTNNTGAAIAAGVTFNATLTGFKLVGFSTNPPA